MLAFLTGAQTWPLLVAAGVLTLAAVTLGLLGALARELGELEARVDALDDALEELETGRPRPAPPRRPNGPRSAG